ncbi:MAG: 3TM-type holin [Thalassobaculaceae bacterium]
MLDKLIEPVSGLLGKVIQDKDQAAKLAHEVATMADRHSQELALAQLEILKADAKGNWFQSSWRPLIGWLGGIGLGVNYIVSPICAGFGVNIPQADMSVMMPLLLGMLGMAGARSFDKLKGTDSKK